MLDYDDEEKKRQQDELLKQLVGGDDPAGHNPYGALEAPTLNMDRRPYVENDDGSTSTVRSMGINENGKEILIPTVSQQGWVMGDDQAVDEYHRTGEHMGVYDSPAASDRAGEGFHQDQMRNPPVNTLQYRHVQLPEVSITAGDRESPGMKPDLREEDFQTPPDTGARVAPARGLTAARDATSQTRDLPMRGNADLPEPARVSDGTDGIGAGMDWGTLAALALDLAGNHGRGVGQLVGAYANNADKSAREKKAHQDRLAEIAARKGADAKNRDMQDWAQTDASQRDWNSQDLRSKELDARDRALAITEGRYGQAQRADSPINTAKVEVAGNTARARVEGSQGAKHALNDEIAADAGNISAGRTNAVTDALSGNPRAMTTDQTADNARADAALEEAKRGRAATEGLRADQERQHQTNDFNTKYGSAIETLNAANVLQQLIGDKGDIAGVGPVVSSRFMPDALKSDEAIKEQQAFAAFQNPGFVARSGKAVTPTEAPRLEGEFGKLSSTNPEVVRNAVKAIAETMRGTIKRGSVGREDIAREVLSSQHLDDVLGPAAAQDAPASAADALPQTRGAPAAGDVLPVQRGAGPKVSDVTGDQLIEPKRSYQLRSPKGKTGPMTLSQEELQKLVAKGFTVL